MSEEKHPVDQLVDLLVYAPIGLLYERDDVLQRLVTRGRSQVQIARVLGQLAVRRGQGQLGERLGDVLGAPGGGLARLVTELGALIGLAPPPQQGTTDQPAVPPAVLVPRPEHGRSATVTAGVADGGTAGEALPGPTETDEPGGGEVAAPPGGTAAEEPPAGAPAGGPVWPPLPIAGYDRLPARELIPLLVDLSPAQRAVVRRHEAANRGRKTVLNQIDRLGT